MHTPSAFLAAPRVYGALSPPFLHNATCVSPNLRRPLRRSHRSNRVVCAAQEHAASEARPVTRDGSPRGVTVILLAGGVGKRMGTKIPKQMLELRGLTVLERSLAALSQLPEVSELVVVLSESLRESPAGRACAAAGAIFASPGSERVDSVAAGVRAASSDATMFCVHDAARPLVRRSDVRMVIEDAWKSGAAVLGVPCKATVKSSADGVHVDETLDRSKLWEMQTPQVIDADTLRRGLKMAESVPSAKVTDDVSLVELLGLPVVLTRGAYDNIKITTPEDMLFADAVLQAAEQQQADATVVAAT